MGIFGANRILHEKDVPASVEEPETNYDDVGEDDEAAGDATTADAGDEEPVEEDDPNYDLPEDEEPEEEEPVEEEEPEDEPEDTGEDTEGNYDLPEDDGDDTTGGEEEPAGDGETDTGDDEGGSEEVEDEEVENPDISEELFKDLTDEQKTIRDRELYMNYYRMYNTVSDLDIKLGKVPRNGNILHKLDYVSDTVKELKQLVYDYIIYTFNTKSYVENHRNYYEFIATFNKINKMLEDLGEKEDK